MTIIELDVIESFAATIVRLQSQVTKSRKPFLTVMFGSGARISSEEGFQVKKDFQDPSILIERDLIVLRKLLFYM